MKITLLCCALFLSFSINAQEAIEGIWNTGKDNTKIEITGTNGIYEGKIVASDDAKVKTKIGNQLLKDVQLVDGKWKGKLYSAKKGKWFDVTLKGKGDILQAKVKAGMMKKTLEWTKE